jgi:hypothetical protein
LLKKKKLRLNGVGIILVDQCFLLCIILICSNSADSVADPDHFYSAPNPTYCVQFKSTVISCITGVASYLRSELVV